jgi:aldose 1-epimerase
MTCPPDALNSGTGLITLAPGEEWTGSWGIRSL